MEPDTTLYDANTPSRSLELLRTKTGEIAVLVDGKFIITRTTLVQALRDAKIKGTTQNAR